MKENMFNNFDLLYDRVLETMEKTNLEQIKMTFKSITTPTIVSGVGGSHVVSQFMAKVLSTKNNIICENMTPRDLIYMNKSGYQNVVVCSYSGNNFGVDTAFNNDLNKYLFSKTERDNVININYKVLNSEDSFVSLAATLIPITLLLYYYCEDIDLIKTILHSKVNFKINDGNIYEILSGYETSTATEFIESTLVESGIGIPIVHDKYDFCHGRTTLGYKNNTNLIFFDCNNQLDILYRKELNNYYDNIISLNKKFNDEIINDYYLTYISMLLCKEIACKQDKDLSNVDYSPLVKKLYYFKGEM